MNNEFNEIKTGVFTVIGRPNVGKSTLVNTLCGVKVTIVSSKPQTTRTRITGILNRPGSQLVFIDTPGLHKAKNRLGDRMVQSIYETVEEVDAAILVVEPVPRIGVPERILIDKLKESGIPCILVINKIDTLDPRKTLAVIAEYNKELSFEAVIPLSAKTNDGTDILLAELDKLCIDSPPLFPEDQVSDKSEEYMLAEIIREKLLEALDQEIPHGIAVMVEKTEYSEKGVFAVNAVIVCERASHKGMIIGKNGAMLKSIGSLARTEMEARRGEKVFLELWVKVKEDWRNRPEQLINLVRE